MGYLDGFGVTLRQIVQAHGKRHRAEYPTTDEARPKPERLHGRHVLNRYEDGMEKCIGCELCAGVCPAQLHLRARRRQPARRPGVAGRALRLRLRDQLPALHPLRPVRRGVPDRGDHRDEAVRVLVHQPRATRSTPRTSCSSTTTAAPSACRGRTGAAARTTTRSAWMRATAPSRRRPTYEGRVGWSGELGFGVRPPEPGQASRAPATSRRRPRRRRRARATDGAVDLLRRAPAIVLGGALGVVLARNPVHSALLPRRSRCSASPCCSSPQDAALPRRGAGDRLRRRDRRAVPVRDHAARRRPRRDLATSRSGASGRSRRSSLGVVGCSSQVVVARRPPLGHRRARRRAATLGDAATGGNVEHARRAPVHRLRLAVRDHRGAARDRGGRRASCSPAAAASGRRADGAEPTSASDAVTRRRRSTPTPTYYLRARRGAVHASARSACSCGATRS